MPTRIEKLSLNDKLPDVARKAIRRDIFHSVKRGDYPGAMRKAAVYRARHPRDFAVLLEYAWVLGDYSTRLEPGPRRKAKARSLRLMRALLRRCRHEHDRDLVSTLRNEFYWQTKNRRAQYDLGTRDLKRGDKLGCYSQGVGAAWHAYELARRGLWSRARAWARRARTAWGRHARIRPDYYNQFVHRALAEGVLGDMKAMEWSLSRGARKAPQARREFDEVRRLVTALSAGPQPRRPVR